MRISKAQIEGNSLVGLYVLPLDNKVIVGTDLTDEMKKTVEEVFNGEITHTTIAGTPLVGAFCATDGEKLLVPHIIFDHEKEALEKANIPFKIVKSDFTCHGNNIVVTKKGLIINPEYELEAVEEIEEFFELQAAAFDTEDMPTVGSFIAHNSHYGLVNHDFSEETLQFLSNTLGLVLTAGTVNMGSVHINSGVAVNDHGFLIGEQSGGPEIVNADEGLGFINQDK